MEKIKINCDCGKSHEVSRDQSAPKSAISMGCNFCLSCEDEAEDHYNEWYNYSDPSDVRGDPNQLLLFSITDDILKPLILNES